MGATSTLPRSEQSLLCRMGWTKRKGTKDGRSVPPPEVLGPMKDAYLQAIQTIVEEHDIPASMIMNFDQTRVKIVHTSSWTLHPSGTGDSQVSIAGIDDKCQITMVLVNTPAGHLLPPQVVHAGTIVRCHSTFQFLQR